MRPISSLSVLQLKLIVKEEMFLIDKRVLLVYI